MDIDAPREVVFAQVSQFKNFTNWSPWHFMDPAMKISIEGPDGAVGTVYKWDSQVKNVGKGYQKILAVSPGRLDYEVDFGLEPSKSYFLIEGDTLKSKITWGMDMSLPFLMKAGGMFTDLNAYVGKDYENGLANLKKYCEALAPKQYNGYTVTPKEIAAASYAMIREVVDFQNIPSFFELNFPKAIQAVEKAGGKLAGHPSGFFWTYDTLALKTDMAAAIQLDKPLKAIDSMEILSLGGNALVIEHLGDPSKTGEAHMAMDEYMALKKLQSIPPALEEYVTDPTQEPDTAKWLTRIIYFVKAKVDSTAVDQK